MEDIIITPHQENLVVQNKTELAGILSRWFGKRANEVAERCDLSVSYSDQINIGHSSSREFYLGQNGNILTVGRHTRGSNIYHRIAQIKMNF